MGEAKDLETLISRATLSPQLISLLYDMQSKLTGVDLTRERDLQVDIVRSNALYLVTGSYLTTSVLTEAQTDLLKDFLPIQQSDDAIGVNTGFRAHLDVLRILLNSRVRGAISDLELGTLKAQAERQPHNALFIGAYEKFTGGSKAIDLLLSEKHFPKDKLPNNHEQHCINYLFSRDEESEDWIPCKDEKISNLYNLVS